MSPAGVKVDEVLTQSKETNSKVVRRATTEDIEKVSNTIYLAFLNYPYKAHLFRNLDEEESAERKKAIARVAFLNTIKTGHTATVNDGQGVALWFYGDIPLDIEGLKGGKGHAFQEFMQIEDAMEAAWNTKRPIARLNYLCVHPDHQGKGLGKALLLECIRRVDEVSGSRIVSTRYYPGR